jgi:hypothetical protein
MKRTLLVALLACSGAQAQTALPSCLPSGLGVPSTGTTIKTGSDGWGAYYSWWCRTPAGGLETEPFVVVVLHDFRVTGNANPRLAQVITSFDPLQLVRGMLKQFAVAPTGPYVAPYNALVAKGKLAWTSAPPPVVPPVSPTVPPVSPVPPAASPAYIVGAATSADGTRPAYALAGTTRAATSSARAPTGAACTPVPITPASSTVWGTWSGGSPSLVVLCIKAP